MSFLRFCDMLAHMLWQTHIYSVDVAEEYLYIEQVYDQKLEIHLLLKIL